MIGRGCQLTYRDGWPLDSMPPLSISPALLQLESTNQSITLKSSSSASSLLASLTAPALLLQWTSDLITIN